MRGVTRQRPHGRVARSISTRTPHAGSDSLREMPSMSERSLFQPALPMRGVTKRRFPKMLRVIFQPALPMRGVTSPSSDDRATVSFQPALPMRGVTMTKLTRGFTFLFQPALPMRGVTAGDDGRCVTGHISTRTPHAGSDCNIMCKFTASINI